MPNHILTRATLASDIPDLRRVADEVGERSAERLEDLILEHLERASSREIWLTCELNGEAVGYCHAVFGALSPRTWTISAMAIAPAAKGMGLDRRLRDHIERLAFRMDRRIAK